MPKRVVQMINNFLGLRRNLISSWFFCIQSVSIHSSLPFPPSKKWKSEFLWPARYRWKHWRRIVKKMSSWGGERGGAFHLNQWREIFYQEYKLSERAIYTEFFFLSMSINTLTSTLKKSFSKLQDTLRNFAKKAIILKNY